MFWRWEWYGKFITLEGTCLDMAFESFISVLEDDKYYIFPNKI